MLDIVLKKNDNNFDIYFELVDPLLWNLLAAANN